MFHHATRSRQNRHKHARSPRPTVLTPIYLLPNPLLTTPTTHQNHLTPFLRLPSELSNTIYTLALGP